MKRKAKIFISVRLLRFIACIAVILLLALVAFPPTKSTPPPSVTTKTGMDMTGLTTFAKRSAKQPDTKIHEFHNIPYAKPPVGPLRFAPPQPLEAQEEGEVFDATDATIRKCIQTTGKGSEDCLVLTVRTPDLKGSRPVIMWIHGGGLVDQNGFMPGYSFDTTTTAELDLVTVNINYRLGILGFNAFNELWDANTGVYANSGIRDMIAALDWIQDNIVSFGGDPDRVTLVGQSGGATVVLALTCSPLANNKFHAGIAQSPAPEFRFTHTQGDEYQRTIVDQLCPGSTDIKQCLMDTPAEEFSRKSINVVNGDAYFLFPMSLSEDAEKVGLILVDPKVVTVEPRDLASASFTPTKPLKIIISNTAQENAMHDTQFATEDDMRTGLAAAFAKITNESNIVDTITSLYPTSNPGHPILFPAYSNHQWLFDTISTDLRSTCPSNDVAEAMAAAPNREIYRLYLEQNSGFAPAIHAYDASAMFGYVGLRAWGWILSPSARDLKFTQHYLDMIGELAAGRDSFSSGWGEFPGESMVYGNSAEIDKVSSVRPQEEICKEFGKFALLKYGWQNK